MVENKDMTSDWKVPQSTDDTLLTGSFSFNPASPALSRLIMNNDWSFLWHFQKPKPNRWRCLWYWLLLGWKWEDVDDG